VLVGLTTVEALHAGLPFSLLVHTKDDECLKSPDRLAGVASGVGRRRRLRTTVQSSATITSSRGNVDGGRTGSFSPAAQRSDGDRVGLVAGGEISAVIIGASTRIRPQARSLKICDDLLCHRLRARFSMDDDRDLGEAGEGGDGRKGDAP
jgi:hypothetical protein